ncbi:MAG: ABC transporter permease [Steroidobacteraceae bacterium]
MSPVGLTTIARLTLLEASRRRITLAALAGGLVCVLIFAVSVYFIAGTAAIREAPLVLHRLQLQMLTLAGLYVVNFLVVAAAVLLPIDTLSGEIASGIMQTLASKPISRSSIVLGKLLAYWIMLAGYIVVMVLGVVLSMRLLAGFVQPHVPAAMGLMLLEATVLLAIVFAGGVHLSTVTTGVVGFAFYAVAFIGGWIEQIGVLATRSADARYIGTVISLASPVDALWRLAMHVLEPPVISQTALTPFSAVSVPTAAMVWWAVAYAVAALALAVRQFERRAL